MQLFNWAVGSLLGHSKEQSPDDHSTAWPGAEHLPSGLAESNDSIRQGLIELARERGVERLVLFRANGGLFCGRNDGNKDSFSSAIQHMAVGARGAARRMGLGVMESLMLESEDGSLVIAIGHSVCGAECGPEAQPEFVLSRLEPLAGVDENKSTVRRGEGR